MSHLDALKPLFWEPLPLKMAWIGLGLALLLLILAQLGKRPSLLKSPSKCKKDPFAFTLNTTSGCLPLNNPRRGTLVVGMAGSGKTKSVIEPALLRFLEKGYCGILYDYDFEPDCKGHNYSLSHFSRHILRQFGAKNIKFHCLNFSDPSRSVRFNPISPAIIARRTLLLSSLQRLMKGLNPKAKQDFWRDNAQALLAGTIVALSNRFPKHCTLPHVIALLTGGEIRRVMALIQADPEAAMYASPALAAFTAGADQQLAGILGTVNTYLSKMATPEVFWVLSGSDLPTPINSAEKPILLALGGSKTEQDAVGPLLAMGLNVLTTQMYGHDRHKSFLVIDELPTLRFDQIAEVIATARKYNIASLVGIQDIKQLHDELGTTTAEKVINAFGNVLFGSTSSWHSAELASKLVGRHKVREKSFSSGKNGHKSTSIQYRWENRLEVDQVMAFRPGEFCGRVVESNRSVFKTRLRPIAAYTAGLTQMEGIPKVHTQLDLKAHSAKIHREARSLLKFAAIIDRKTA